MFAFYMSAQLLAFKFVLNSLSHNLYVYDEENLLYGCSMNDIHVMPHVSQYLHRAYNLCIVAYEFECNYKYYGQIF